MKRVSTILLVLLTWSAVRSQTTGNPNTGDAYLLFGPNTSWGQYLKVGGNGRGTTHASVVATNGNLHLDSKDGYSTYISHYSQGKTLMNTQGGFVGVGTTNPIKPFHIASSLEHHQIRLQGLNGKHSWMQFYPDGSGVLNWQIGANTYGFSIYDLVNSSYKLTISNSGNIGIGTNSPDSKLHLYTSGGPATYPTITTKGDVVQSIRSNNNGLEIGNSRGFNDRKAWILARHNSVSSYGQVYSAFHLQPDVGDKTYYKGVAIGYGVSEDLPIGTHLAINGKVGIGTTNPGSYKLAVKGKIRAEEIKVETGWADYVFKEGYDLPTLEEVEKHIQEKGHLINIPSAKEVKEHGVQLGEMNKLLLEKIEELTLYTLEQERKIKELEDSNKRITLLEKTVGKFLKIKKDGQN